MKRAQNTTPAVPPCRGWHGALRQPSQLVPPQSPAGREPLAVNRQPLAVRARARRGGTRLRRSWGGRARAVPQPPALRPAGGGWRRHSGFGSPGLAETRSPLAPGAPQRAAHTHGDVSSPQPGCWAPAAKGKGGWGGSLLPPCNERIGEAPSTGFAYMYLSACTLSQFLWGMSTVYFIFFFLPLWNPALRVFEQVAPWLRLSPAGCGWPCLRRTRIRGCGEGRNYFSKYQKKTQTHKTRTAPNSP